MSALSVIGSTQITAKMAPLTLTTGGTSKSDPSAGQTAPHNAEDEFKKHPITKGDRAGAAILTMIVVGTILGISVWIIM